MANRMCKMRAKEISQAPKTREKGTNESSLAPRMGKKGPNENGLAPRMGKKGPNENGLAPKMGEKGPDCSPLEQSRAKYAPEQESGPKIAKGGAKDKIRRKDCGRLGVSQAKLPPVGRRLGVSRAKFPPVALRLVKRTRNDHNSELHIHANH